MRYSRMTAVVGAFLATSCDGTVQNTDQTPGVEATQALQPLDNCKPCHLRQYDETLQSLMTGYRSVSPLMNALELAGNYGLNGLLRPRYGQPSVSDDRPSGTNNLTTENVDEQVEAASAFCSGCHLPGVILRGENPETREIPEWTASRLDRDNDGFAEFGPTSGTGELLRPLRDYHLVTAKEPGGKCDYGRYDETCTQILPTRPGGSVPGGARPSLGAHGISCDVCHNAQAPALLRSLQEDGFANAALDLCQEKDENGNCAFSRVKIGPFADAAPVGALPEAGEDQVFHGSSPNPDHISYLRDSLFCISCHDVRVPVPNLIVPERISATNMSPNPVPHFRLENLGTEWLVQAYANPNDSRNPFGHTVRCQDCHMSLYPYTETAQYTVTDPTTGEDVNVTSPRPGNGMTGDGFPTAKAAVADPARGEDFDVTGRNFPLPDRKVVTHQITGIDVPLMSDAEIRERLGPDRPSSCHDKDLDPSDPSYTGPTLSPEDRAFCEGKDAFGVPNSIAQRRRDLLDAAVRVSLDRSDKEARLGETFNVRATAVALTGHNFPAGFSQERTTWLEITVTGKNARDGGRDVVLYQSGYQVDKAHPETNEMEPDGSCHDEDLEHLDVVVNPFNGNNDVFACGPDAGPLERAFEGEKTGLVLFRNELIRFYGPPCYSYRDANNDGTRECEPTRLANIDADQCRVVDDKCTYVGPADRLGANNFHPRTGEPMVHFLEEETFSAGAARAVDNWRALLPLVPRTYRYEVQLPSAQQLEDLGIEITGSLTIKARVHFQHFPPLFLRFLARASGSVPYAVPPERSQVPGFTRPSELTGIRGAANYDFDLIDEQRIDEFVRTIEDIAVAEQWATVQ